MLCRCLILLEFTSASVSILWAFEKWQLAVKLILSLNSLCSVGGWIFWFFSQGQWEWRTHNMILSSRTRTLQTLRGMKYCRCESTNRSIYGSKNSQVMKVTEPPLKNCVLQTDINLHQLFVWAPIFPRSPNKPSLAISHRSTVNLYVLWCLCQPGQPSECKAKLPGHVLTGLTHSVCRWMIEELWLTNSSTKAKNRHRYEMHLNTTASRSTDLDLPLVWNELPELRKLETSEGLIWIWRLAGELVVSKRSSWDGTVK